VLRDIRYTKVSGEIKEYTIFPLSEPIDSIMALDVSDLDVEEVELVEAKLKVFLEQRSILFNMLKLDVYLKRFKLKGIDWLE